MITEKQYLENMKREMEDAKAKFFANGGSVKRVKAGTPKSIRDLTRGYGYMGGRSRWMAVISERNADSKGLSLRDLNCKFPRPDRCVR